MLFALLGVDCVADETATGDTPNSDGPQAREISARDTAVPSLSPTQDTAPSSCSEVLASAAEPANAHASASSADTLARIAPPYEQLRHMMAVDRNGVRIGGCVVRDGDYVFLSMNWNEPLAIAFGEPLRMAEGVQIAKGVIVFTNAEVVPTQRDPYAMPF